MAGRRAAAKPRRARNAASRSRRRLKRIDELVEIGLEMLAAQAVIDAQGPDFEVGEDAVHPWTGTFSGGSSAPMTRGSSLMPGPPQ